MGEERTGVRIDRWLWAARFYKTRSQAAHAVKAGRVEHKGMRVKASQVVKPGYEVEVRKGPFRFAVKVLALADRRGSADIARGLFEESADSVRTREEVRARLAAEYVGGNSLHGGRPTKKQRRQLMQLRERMYFAEDFDDEESGGDDDSDDED